MPQNANDCSGGIHDFDWQIARRFCSYGITPLMSVIFKNIITQNLVARPVSSRAEANGGSCLCYDQFLYKVMVRLCCT